MIISIETGNWITRTNFITKLLDDSGCPLEYQDVVTVIIVALITYGCYLLFKYVFEPLIRIIVKHTKTKWDDMLVNSDMLRALAQLVPAVALLELIPVVFSGQIRWLALLFRFSEVYVLFASAYLLSILLANILKAMEHYKKGDDKNLSVLFDGLRVVIYVIAAVIAVAIISNSSLGRVLAALGASAAVLMLVFQDTIKGFVACVQLTINGMIKKGDWVVCDKAGINGEVADIKLTTVKVRNWDNSMATIPPYTLFTDSFRNYENMRNSGARRVDRSFTVSFESIRFLTARELEALHSRGLITDGELKGADKQVNLSLFRSYLQRYLASRPDIMHEKPEDSPIMTMVRQLQPTSTGVPIGLYFFTHLTDWEVYEQLQADVFDHVYACVREFGLRIYQAPTSADFHKP